MGQMLIFESGYELCQLSLLYLVYDCRVYNVPVLRKILPNKYRLLQAEFSAQICFNG